MPVIPIKEYSWAWRETLRKNLAILTATGPINPNNKFVNKCPAINDILNTGWIMRAYTDITITSNVVISRDQWGSVTDDRISGKTNGLAEYGGTGLDWFMNGHNIDTHGPGQFGAHRPTHPRSNCSVIKFSNPWFCTVPDGYSLLLMPIPYPDNYNFQSSIGTLKGTNWLNIQLFWHNAGSIGVIPKGTPLNLMVLVKDEPIEAEVVGLQPREAAKFMRHMYYKFDDQYVEPMINGTCRPPPPETRRLLSEEEWTLWSKKKYRQKNAEYMEKLNNDAK